MAQLNASGFVALHLNDRAPGVAYDPAMDPIAKIHGAKTPMRIHFIAQWAAHRGLKQKDVVKELGVDKGTVSRWFGGSLPAESNLPGLAALFHCEINDLFRDPGDDWIKAFFDGRREEEVARIRATLEAAFPKQVA